MASWSLLPERPSVCEWTGRESMRSWRSRKASRCLASSSSSSPWELPFRARFSSASCTSSRRITIRVGRAAFVLPQRVEHRQESGPNGIRQRPRAGELLEHRLELWVVESRLRARRQASSQRMPDDETTLTTMKRPGRRVRPAWLTSSRWPASPRAWARSVPR
jgi:hypothetical protein